MTWEFSQPQPGDAIRVLAGSIYHMGIFVSDDEVIQFGPNPALMAQTSPQEIRVMRVGIDEIGRAHV